jgi:uncharacterized protein (TIGR03382 family)
VPLPTFDFSASPDATAGPETVSASSSSATLLVQQATFSATFSADGSEIGDGAGSGHVDTRPLVPLVDPGGPPDAICDLLAGIGTTCVACPDGSGSFCVWSAFEGLELAEVPTTLVEVTDPTSDPSCKEEVALCEGCAAGGATGATTFGWTGLVVLLRRRRR